MIRRAWLLVALTAATVAALSIFGLIPASAASTTVLGVTPAIQNIVAQPSEQSTSYQAAVTNNSNQSLTVHVSTVDFTSLGTGGGLVFLKDSQRGDEHGLANSLRTDNADFVLGPHGVKQVQIQLDNLPALAAGGHYAAVVFQTASGTNTASSKSQVSLKQSVASLVFLTTSGQGTYQLKLAEPSIGLHLFGVPNEFNLLFQNSGNVQTAPRGYINISSSTGQQLSKTILNPDSALVLPGTSRLLQAQITPSKQAIWPGIYTVKVFYRADNTTKFDVTTSHFFYLGWPAAVLIIIVFVLLIFWLRMRIFGVQKSSR